MVFGMGLTYSEVGKILDVKYTATSSRGYTLPLRMYKSSDIYVTSKSSLPDEVKTDVASDDIRLESNLKKNKTIRFY